MKKIYQSPEIFVSKLADDMIRTSTFENEQEDFLFQDNPWKNAEGQKL